MPLKALVSTATSSNGQRQAREPPPTAPLSRSVAGYPTISSHVCEKLTPKTLDKLRHLLEPDALLGPVSSIFTASTSGTIAASKASVKCQIWCI
ncbi:hypothetical protein CRG98_035371 [Punica granatum]|uniref:Uncharacterized protein n=1 Tax=Punica granatum TaxID=22663 RepID=A0A2I0IJV9_PUNGR|nr:hypothetical protein CRG98_035371 [Punica granatum]